MSQEEIIDAYWAFNEANNEYLDKMRAFHKIKKDCTHKWEDGSTAIVTQWGEPSCSICGWHEDSPN